MTSTEPGTLRLVATPIGNLEDITYRAVRVLGEAAIIAAEDTRSAMRLLSHYGLRRPRLVSFFAGNEAARSAELVGELLAGSDVAVISDAGTPGISDPGARLVAAVHEAGLSVTPVPGPSAVTALLSCAGFPGAHFEALGFLPKASGARTKLIAEKLRPGTVLVLFVPMRDAPALLGEIAALRGDALCVLGRELTKAHEEVLRASADELASELDSRTRLLGEATLALWLPPDSERPEPEELLGRARRGGETLLQHGLSRKDAARLVAELTGLPRRRATEIILSIGRS